MPSRTQILCLHEGRDGRSIDPLFIRTLIKRLKPSWIAPWPGNNVIRTVGCHGRKELIEATPGQLRAVLTQGNQVTLMVWADLDDDMAGGDLLKGEFWKKCETEGISRNEFDQIVFAFAKDRLENWIEFLNEGSTDEEKSGPRLKHDRPVADAAKKLAKLCLQGNADTDLPPSLQWSCGNWRGFVRKIK
jgi:hypothetical protein